MSLTAVSRGICYNCKSHQINEQMVSIEQFHVRPIVRGKAGSPVEFGAKVIAGLVGGYAFLMKAEWNNYSEGKSLVQAVGEYRRIFGCDLKTILATGHIPVVIINSGTHFMEFVCPAPSLGRNSSKRKSKFTRMAATALQSKSLLEQSNAAMVWIESYPGCRTPL